MEEDIGILEEVLKDKEWYKKHGGEDIGFREVQAIENLIKGYRELEEENKELKASHIISHNNTSIEEKAKLFDVIDNSIDTYLEQAKPHWEQIMTKEKMTIEEAETIIDDMYQDRNKIISTKNDKGVTIHLDRLDDVKFTNLEFASVRTLREIQSLRRKLDNSIPKSKIKEKIEEIEESMNKARPFDLSYIEYCEDRIEVLQELLGDE